MNKYASQFNELIVLAEKEKTKKKGGSMAAILKLTQDLVEFENNLQEAIDAQEMSENKSKIEAFLADIDKMYEVLFNMAKSSIQSLRSERTMPEVQEEVIEEAPVVEEAEVKPISSFSLEDLKRELDAKPSATSPLTVPKAPR